MIHSFNTGDAILFGGKQYVSLDKYNSIQKDLKTNNKILDMLLEEVEYLKTVVENKKQMKIVSMQNR